MSSVEASQQTEYENPAVSVDVVIFTLRDEHLQVLLWKRPRPPYQGVWSIPGGFVPLDESLEDTAGRKLAEKTGVTDVYLEQLFTFGNLDRDPRTRVITVAYFALVPYTAVENARADTLVADGETGWFKVDALPELAFDHAEILDYALTRLRYKLEYSMVGFELLPDEFTLTDLQRAYELILGEELDKRNFRRKIKEADILEPTGRKRREGEGRPAELFRYREDAEAEIKTRRLFP
ncbi:MAG: NUDIX hydrolase [Anaerolineales bacterium]|nr:NUDIX hydrolase [Anaerolineales bacterium]MCB0004880.1 NUDIX hydrolase [Anaerolineales bacterium]MCB8961975.1 NUDIX hydrolase [Ardenticatenales bacterium]